LDANARGVRLTVTPIEDGIAIEADRQILAAVVGNLLQNAFKFTRPRTTVTLRVGASAERVLIEILLLVAWLLGFVGIYTVGSFIHVLLVVAIVLFLVGLITGRRVLG
jgi:signal transduction histidine kinase